MKRFVLWALLFTLLPSLAQAQTSVVHKNTAVWTAPGVTAGTVISGYNIYKAVGSCTGTFVKLNTALITTLTFVDSGLVDGSVACYYLTTVSTGSQVGESSPSGTWLATTPTFSAPAPQPPPSPGGVTVLST